MAAFNGIATAFSQDAAENPTGNSARALRVVFTTTGTGVDRLSMQLEDFGLFGGVQTIYYDASLVGTTANILIRPILQNIPVTKNSAGYVRVLVPPSLLVMEVSSSNGIVLPIILIGGVVEPMVWAGL